MQRVKIGSISYRLDFSIARFFDIFSIKIYIAFNPYIIDLEA